jgi:hypothetical protein
MGIKKQGEKAEDLLFLLFYFSRESMKKGLDNQGLI